MSGRPAGWADSAALYDEMAQDYDAIFAVPGYRRAYDLLAGEYIQALLPASSGTVVDAGCGIAPELLPQLFDRFRQDEGTTGRRRSGRGLGLTIVRRLVDLHGGTVSADSPGEGQGATFTVRIPTGISPLPAAVRS